MEELRMAPLNEITDNKWVHGKIVWVRAVLSHFRKGGPLWKRDKTKHVPKIRISCPNLNFILFVYLNIIELVQNFYKNFSFE